MIPMESQVEGIVDTILEDYRNGREIDKIDDQIVDLFA